MLTLSPKCGILPCISPQGQLLPLILLWTQQKKTAQPSGHSQSPVICFAKLCVHWIKMFVFRVPLSVSKNKWLKKNFKGISFRSSPPNPFTKYPHFLPFNLHFCPGIIHSSLLIFTCIMLLQNPSSKERSKCVAQTPKVGGKGARAGPPDPMPITPPPREAQSTGVPRILYPRVVHWVSTAHTQLGTAGDRKSKVVPALQGLVV